MILQRKSIANNIEFTGEGLQTGKMNRCIIYPANAGDGITFCRILKSNSTEDPYPVRAHYSCVDNDKAFVSLRCRNYFYYSVEHILALLYGHQITDATILLDNGEVPADIQQISESLLVEGLLLNSFYEPDILPPVFFEKGNSSITYFPSEIFAVSCYFEFLNLFSYFDQYMIDPINFHRKLSHARTFGTHRHIEDLQKKGFAKGVKLTNTLVFDLDSPIGAEFVKQECTRHKIFDFLGDLSLCGRQVRGIFMLRNPSHSMTREFIKEYLGG